MPEAESSVCSADSWDESAVKTWKKKAEDIQKYFYLAFQGRQWDEYNQNEFELLRVKICYAIFGLPKDDINDYEDIEKAYTQEERDEASKIKNKILDVHNEKSGGRLGVGTIFIFCKQAEDEYPIPIFRVRVKGGSYYVDLQCRVYDSWTYWRKTNTLPKLKYCFPKHGYYSCVDNEYKFDPKQDPLLEFDTALACSVLSDVSHGLDIASAVVGVIAGIAGIISLFTPVGPIVLGVAAASGAASAAWGTGRSIQRLIDKHTHEESLTDFESILLSTTILATPFFFISSATTSTLQAGAKIGRVFSPTFRTVVTILNTTSLTLDATLLVMGFVNLLKKNLRDVSPLEVLQFVIGSFFFTHTLIQPKTASGILAKAQENHFNDYHSKVLTDAQAQQAFERFIEQNNKNIEKGVQIARTINKINDPDSFFKAVSDENVDVKVTGEDGNTVIINKDVVISPNRFNQLETEIAQKLVLTTKQFKLGEINLPQYKKIIGDIRRNERISFETQRSEVLSTLAKFFDTDENGLKDISINGNKLFENVKGHEIDRVGVVFSTAGNYNKDMITAAFKVAEDLHVKSLEDHLAVIELVAAECAGKKKGEKKVIIEGLQNNETKRREFVEGIEQDRQTADKIFENSEYKFISSVLAAYHFRKHGHEFGEHVTMEIYLTDFPQDLFQESNLFKNVYNQDGIMQIKSFVNPSDDYKFGVLVKSGNDKQWVATIFRNKTLFQDWTQGLATAKEQLEFTRIQFTNSRPDVNQIKSWFREFFQHIGKHLSVIIGSQDINIYFNQKNEKFDDFFKKSHCNLNEDDLKIIAEALTTLARLNEMYRV